MHLPEMCFNVWAFYEPLTNIVQHTSVRSYALKGSTEEKLAVLKSLAPSDLYSAQPLPIPDKYVLHGSDGRAVVGALPAQDLEPSGAILGLMETAASNPPQYNFAGSAPVIHQIEFPENPLFVLTFVEETSDGSLQPQVS